MCKKLQVAEKIQGTDFRRSVMVLKIGEKAE